MSFERLLPHFDSEAGQKEQVALAIYCIEENTEDDEVTQSDVRDVISNSRSNVQSSSIPQYFSRLDDGGWVTSVANDGYRLTIPGTRNVEGLLDDDALDNPRGDLFIDTDEVDHHYYESLLENINKSYQHRIYDATLVLSRKFFEHLVYTILEGHYGGDDPSMFFNTDEKQQLGFGQLVENLRSAEPDLRMYSRDISGDLIDELDKFREHGNEGAHSIRVDVTEEEIEEMADGATRLAEILYDIFLGVRRRDDS
jgi:hypothetical protein